MICLIKRGMAWLRFEGFCKKIEKILLAIVLLFFFLIFPIFLLYISVSAYFDARESNLRQNVLSILNKELATINEYSSNQRYYHNLLSNISRYAQIDTEPVKFLQVNINNLKNNYPGDFSFIVWDDKGKVIKDLTDWPGYSFAFEKVYLILKKITELTNQNYELKIEELEIVNSNLNILRNVFGNAFLPENLKSPLGKGLDVGPFIVDTSSSLSTAWYAIGNKISFVCFISKSLLDEKSGLEKIVIHSKEPQSYCYSGFFKAPDFNYPYSDLPNELFDSVRQAVTIYENAGENLYEDSKTIVKFSIPEPSIRTFACYPKTEQYWQKEYNKTLWLMILTCILFLFYCICGYVFIFKGKFLSLRWKILALMLFVNAVPSIVLGCIAFDYSYNKKSDLKNNLVNGITSELKIIDSKALDVQKAFESRIQNAFKILNNECREDSLDETKLNKFYDSFKKSIEINVIVVASDSKVISCIDKSNEFNKTVIKTLCESLLAFTNDAPHTNNSILGNAFKPENCKLVRNANVYQGRISPLKLDFFAFPGMCFYDFIKDKGGKKNDYCVFLFWNSYEFKKVLFSKHFNSLKSKSNIDYLGFEYNLNNMIISDWDCKKKQHKGQHGANNSFEWAIRIDEKQYQFVMLKSISSPNWSIIGACTYDKINNAIFWIILKITLAIIGSFLLCFVFVYNISINFLNPIKSLNEATMALKRGDFEHRIGVAENDEFGYLQRILNRVIESFGELNIAQNFQKALAPKNSDKIEKISIYGKTEVMTTLGGDYYDSFAINDDFLGVIIGDVAGHGVASGLIMAMAKAGVLTADETTKLDPSLMLKRLNEIILNINSDSLKRMMTAQYFVINVKTGLTTYANAGHCFPYLFRKSEQKLIVKEEIGLPLGIKKSLKLKNIEFNMDGGDSLILYTDGTFEFTDKNHEKFDYKNFKEILASSFNEDTEKFYQNISGKISENRLGKAEDDITIVVVNRGE